jgi:hypothetical protein
MKERSILFSAPMVRAILAGTKTQTRRVVHNPHRNDGGFVLQNYGNGWWPYRSHDGESGCYLDRQKDGDYYSEAPLRCPYGQPGDRLWVRETFMHEPADYCWGASVSIPCRPAETVYRADHDGDTRGAGWKPSIHMPRAASRITLEITDVRVERLQDISEADALAEGIVPAGDKNGYQLADTTHYSGSPIDSYFSLWEHINGAGSVEANPWVWVVEWTALLNPRAVRPTEDGQ